MAYLALYRQWRPQDFDNLIGQDHINATLKNAIASDKVAHAYLFAGPRGTGKTSTAKILAKALNCARGPTSQPCNVCAACERITNGSSMDVFEIDAASNRGIDEIRDLRETVKFAPVEGHKKVYIIDEVHMLTTEAFNALLKTLEEPPDHVVFILATTEPHRIPATIHSRCQRYDFRRISTGAIEDRLAMVARKNAIPVTAEAISLIAAQAEGGMRDALSILDQCASMDAPEITAADVRQLLGLIGHEWVTQLAAALIDRDAPRSLTTIDELIAMGKDGRQVLLEMILHMRSLMLYKAAPAVETIERYSSDTAVLIAQSANVTHSELVEIIRLLHEGANDARWSAEPRISVEMALLSICRRSGGEDLTALRERITQLENKLNSMAGGLAATSQPPPPQRLVQPLPVQTPPVPPRASTVPVQETVRPQTSSAAGTNKTPAPVTGDSKAIWDAVLKQLVSDGKRTVHACVAQGQLVAVDDKTATVRFASQFTKDRTEKDDFRLVMEKILAQITGRELRLHCVLGNAVSPQAAPKAVVSHESQAVPANSAGEQAGEHPVLRQALEMFGGKVVAEE